jgi:SAM-dependent methyltransferase
MMTILLNRREIGAGPCPACQADVPRLFRRTPKLRLVTCATCGLVYTSPQHADRVLRRYLHEYDLAEHFGDLSVRKGVIFDRRLSELPQPLPGRNRLCDVGCADGQFLELAAKRGWEPHGVELNPPAAARARQRGAEVMLGRLEELDDVAWGSFDVVTSWDCLEHVPRSREFVERLVALVRPGGLILLTTLNRRSLVYKVFGSHWRLIQEDHFTYWDRRSLCRLFERAGCVVEEVTSFGLGRDFVRIVDIAAALRSRLRPATRSGPASSGAVRRWDVSTPVLKLERLVNRCLAATGTGVDIYVRVGRSGATTLVSRSDQAPVTLS